MKGNATFVLKSLTMKANLTISGLCLFLIMSSWVAVPAQNDSSTKLYAGISQVDITPDVGYPHYMGMSTAVHDPLFAKAVVFRQGEIEMAFVVCDLLWVSRKLSTAVRLQLVETAGIPFSNVVISATHSHTSPAYDDDILELNEFRRKEGHSTISDFAGGAEYFQVLVDKIAQSVIEAHRNAEKVDLKVAKGKAEGLAFNRRFIMTDGRVRTNPGVNNPDIVRAAGPASSEVNILWLESMGKAFGALIGFANHSDTFGGTEFSGDFPGYLARALAKNQGDKFISLYAQGPSGNINHINVRNPKHLTSEEIGNGLANAITEQLSSLESAKSIRLAAASTYVYAPLQDYNEAELTWAKNRASRSKYGEIGLFARRRPMKIRSLEKIRMNEAVAPTIDTEPWVVPLEVQAFKISDDVAVVAMPGELFSEFGMSIRAASPFSTTIVIQLANSHIAYVPTIKGFAEGGYEALNSRLKPGGGEMMVEAAIGLLNELK